MVNVDWSDSVGYISSGGDITATLIYVGSIYAIKFVKLCCRAIVPRSGLDDRKQWAKRFGIDTSSGCWEEFIKRLSIVAKDLLIKNIWLPIEVQMLKSVIGFYKDGASDE